MFEISIGELLASFHGDNRDYELEEDVPEDVFEDVICMSPIYMNVQIVRVDYGVIAIIRNLSVSVCVDANPEIHEAELHDIEREFYLHHDASLPSDIGWIKDAKIDLTQAIQEELLIAVL